jgi:uncharacterized membrane protein YfcA
MAVAGGLLGARLGSRVLAHETIRTLLSVLLILAGIRLVAF